MLQVVKALNSFNGVGFNSKASMSLPVGPTYNEIHLNTSLSASQIRQVSVVLNGDTIIQVSGDDLLMMEKYKGHYIENGVFVIPFTNPNAKNQNGAQFGGLVTLAGENITLEVEIGGGTGALTLDAIAYQTPAPLDARRVWVPRIRTHTAQATAAGWNDFTTLPTNQFIFLRRVYFKSDLMRLKVERDNLILFDAKAAQQAYQQKRVGRFPQANTFIFDPTQYGFEQSDALNTGHNSEFVFSYEVDTAAPIAILVESIQQVNPINAA